MSLKKICEVKTTGHSSLPFVGSFVDERGVAVEIINSN